MKKLQLKIFGHTDIGINDQQITIPYKKVSLFLIYIVINKKVSRDHISLILWKHLNENERRKNFRNLLYVLKKNFYEDLILTPNRELLELNEKYEIECDYLKFMAAKDDSDLDNFDIVCKEIDFKKIDSNYIFIEELRTASFEKYESIIFDKIEQLNIDDEAIIDYANLIIKYDKNNERAFNSQMEHFLSKKDYKNAIKVFNILERNLKVINKNCSAYTLELFEKIVAINSNSIAKSQKFIYKSTRPKADKLIEEHNRFSKYGFCKPINITGNKGSEKTDLIDYFIDNYLDEETFLIRHKCFGANKKFLMYSVDYIVTECSRRYNTISFPELFDAMQIKYDYSKSKNIKLYETILEYANDLLINLTYHHKIILIVEEAQHLDEYSLRFIKKLILNQSDNLMIIITSNEYSIFSVDDIANNPSRKFIMKKIQIDSLTKEDYQIILSENKMRLDEASIDNNLRISNRNSFILKQAIRINLLTFANSFDVYKKLLARLDDDELRLVRFMAIWTIECSVVLIKNVLKLEEDETFDILNKLASKKIIRYNDSSFGRLYHLSSAQFSKFVYDNLDLAIKRNIHNDIAIQIENDRNYSIFFSKYYKYEFLIKHYSLANNDIKSFEYRIKKDVVKDFFICEMFPLINYELEECIFNYGNTANGTLNWASLENDIIELSTKYPKDEQLIAPIALFQLMKLRFYLMSNDFDQALFTLKDLDEVIDQLSPGISVNILYLRFYYSVNINDTMMMKETLKLIDSHLAKVAEYQSYQKLLVNYYRLYGYFYLIIQDNIKAKNYLNQALKLYNKNNEFLDDVHLASILHYFGQLHLIEGNYDLALSCLNRCHQILLVNNTLGDAIYFTQCLMSIAHFLNKNFKIAWTSCIKIEKMKKFQNVIMKEELINAYIKIVLFNEEPEYSNHSKYDMELFSKIKKRAKLYKYNFQ